MNEADEKVIGGLINSISKLSLAQRRKFIEILIQELLPELYNVRKPNKRKLKTGKDERIRIDK